MKYISSQHFFELGNHGIEINFDAAVNLMDDELREELHRSGIAETEQEFFDAYAEAHQHRFGETWEPAKANPQI